MPPPVGLDFDELPLLLTASHVDAKAVAVAASLDPDWDFSWSGSWAERSPLQATKTVCSALLGLHRALTLLTSIGF